MNLGQPPNSSDARGLRDLAILVKKKVQNGDYLTICKWQVNPLVTSVIFGAGF